MGEVCRTLVQRSAAVAAAGALGGERLGAAPWWPLSVCWGSNIMYGTHVPRLCVREVTTGWIKTFAHGGG